MLSGLCSIPKMVIESTSARFAILSHMSDYQHISHGFEPVFDDRSRILVLGSFPSVQSRKNAFYYGNPQNRFWRVMAACLDEPVPPNEGDPMATTPSPADASAYRDTTTEQILPPTNVNGIHRAATPKWGEASSTKTAAQGEGPANHASLAESIAAKKQLLLAHGIALWDVIDRATSRAQATPASRTWFRRRSSAYWKRRTSAPWCATAAQPGACTSATCNGRWGWQRTCFPRQAPRTRNGASTG